jgi:UDP-N-acetylglucosamine:LPS N-acetylglucosamine transferase
MVDAGAAGLISEPELNAQRLAHEVLMLIDHPSRLVAQGALARTMARPSAVQDIVNLIEGVAIH